MYLPRPFLFGVVVCAALLLSACSSRVTPDKQQQLQQYLFTLLHQAQLPQQALAFVAYPLNEPEQQLGYQASQSMQPASTMKLLTSIVALEQLGPDYRGSTELLAFEQPKTNMTQPLVLKGRGNMDFTVQQLWYLLQQAHDLGIRQVPAIQIDRGWFNPALPELTALPFDEAPRAYYNLLPDALFLQRNMLGIEFTSDTERVTAQLSPSIQAVELLTTDVQLTDASCDRGYLGPQQLAFRRQPSTLQFILLGQFPKNCVKQHYLQLTPRSDLSRVLVQQLWQHISAQASVPVLEQSAPGAKVQLAQHQSRTLAEVLREVNKNSDNAVTRQLFLTLGAIKDSAETELTAQTSERQVRNFIAGLALDQSSLSLENGSGLSRTERISPVLMAALLHHAYQADYQAELISSMPLAGVDGSLKRRLSQQSTKGKARLKTGTLRNVTALAGYVTDQSGQTWVVASFINDPQAQRGRIVLDKLIEWLAQQNATSDVR